MGQTFTTEIQARYRDINLAGHVDNVEAVRVLDEARYEFLRFAVPSRAFPPVRTGLLHGTDPGVSEPGRLADDRVPPSETAVRALPAVPGLAVGLADRPFVLHRGRRAPGRDGCWPRPRSGSASTCCGTTVPRPRGRSATPCAPTSSTTSASRSASAAELAPSGLPAPSQARRTFAGPSARHQGGQARAAVGVDQQVVEQPEEVLLVRLHLVGGGVVEAEAARDLGHPVDHRRDGVEVAVVGQAGRGRSAATAPRPR